ncbi:MAG: hypothetical protein Q9219_006019 [cf. Caloplaca sp. 3 TL-2023]
MLGWLSGTSQRAAAQSCKDDGSNSCIEDPPETPAPVFAVRAFRTALFGTPHPKQREEVVNEQKASPQKPDRLLLSPRAKVAAVKVGSGVHNEIPLISPAKGILLTPGTATTRRKTVSFGNLENGKGIKTEIPDHRAQTVREDSEKVSDSISPEKAEVDHISQPEFTKEHFEAQLEASKQRLSAQQTFVETAARQELSSHNVQHKSDFLAQSASIDSTADITIDLTKPRSQSGQHWKAEYERYQKNSDRELKKIIQYGQNVKSYAEKKDIEATNLQEKLKRELAKCAVMEAKVSKLATQLATGRQSNSDGDGEQERLMNDLSRQTALAVKYKQRADRYRIAINQQNPSLVDAANVNDSTAMKDMTIDMTSAIGGSSTPYAVDGRSEVDSLMMEVDTLRCKLKAAENQVVKLEAANAKLTKNFVRVKDEMQNYDARRVRKEARLKQREEHLLAEKRAYEAKLKRLTEEKEELLCSIKVNSGSGIYEEALVHRQPLPESLTRSRTTPSLEARSDVKQDDGFANIQVPKAADVVLEVNPRRDKTTSNPKQPALEIWTADTPDDTAEVTPPAAEPAINLSHVALSEATQGALREIDNNSVSDFPPELSLPPDTPRPTLEHLAKMNSALQPDFPSSDYPSSATKRMQSRRDTIASPRPSMVSMASSVVKHDGASRAAGIRPRMSLTSGVESRRSTLSGTRGKAADLPPDRAAAARMRLAQRKSMKENRQV